MSLNESRMFEKTGCMNFNHDKVTGSEKQKPIVFWFTGLPGAGKTTIAKLLQERLGEFNTCAVLLDGDEVRSGLNSDLGFSDDDRVENIRRVIEVSRLIVDSGLSVVVSLISPFESDRQSAREKLNDALFVETFIDAPLEICMQRDPKGHYAKARSGQIKQFTGIDSRYEVPENPELHIDTTVISAQDGVKKIIDSLQIREFEGR